jgi:hypothetical protein
MNVPLSDFGIAVFFIAVAAALVLWFRRKLTADSTSRMFRMMAKVGVYPRNFAKSGDGSGLDMNAVRKRCRLCPAEDVCERWLAGEIEGDNGFCPNAEVFDGVVRPV